MGNVRAELVDVSVPVSVVCPASHLRQKLAVARMSATKAGAWFSVNIAWKVDPYLLKLTSGRFSTAGPLATALLESRGARSGQPRRNATLYFHDGDRVTIIASKRGWPTNPAWYYNLRRHPDIVFGSLPFRAEIVEDEAERQRLWDLADRVSGGLAGSPGRLRLVYMPVQPKL